MHRTSREEDIVANREQSPTSGTPTAIGQLNAMARKQLPDMKRPIQNITQSDKLAKQMATNGALGLGLNKRGAS